ncbi:cell adhesion molecule 2-like [Biomphalaria glabrata]|uniref:Cell adhesion molecule 2-like n=1 Tax=Biomphalaria glabrata TaxID=6526 RepID=A0A9W2YWA8_BIOGL|nr:cell adhesion molecule 2-like [Biomphalaria glabrata]
MFLLLMLIAALPVCVTPMEVRSSVTVDNIKGQNALLFCTWTAQVSETPDKLFVLSSKQAYLLQCDVENSPYNCTTGKLLRTKYSLLNSAQGLVSFSISNLSCSDEGIYTCQLLQSSTLHQNSSKSVLNIKAYPSAPSLSNVQTNVQEDSNISATCTAGVGYPNRGQLIWKSYQNGKPVDLTSELYSTSLNVIQPGDDSCPVTTESTVTLKANIKHQNITLACFVVNPDIQPTAPDNCIPSTNLCSETKQVNVYRVKQPDPVVGSGPNVVCAFEKPTIFALSLIVLLRKKIF